jgi:hypothetical protein
VLLNHPVSDAVNINPGNRYRLIRWRNSHQLPLMGATSRPASHHHSPFSNLILNREAGISEGGAAGADR